jgi:DNA repair exonuclease SbcCD ATPase subunit
MQSTDFMDTNPNAKPTTGSLTASRKFGSHNSIADKLHNATTSTSMDAKIALLCWVRIQLEDYITVSIIPPIQDFSRSWRNGVAFCLLIHRHNPAYIPDLFSVHLNANLAERSTWIHLLKLAFSLATDKMGIQAYLEPEDLVDVEFPHEPSVMMYVSEYYKLMSKHQREEPITDKKERAVKRKAAIIMASGGVLDPVEEGIVQEPEPIQELPLEAPVPVPMLSARRKKKMKHRQSSLAEEDKARIKADLNSKLMMQLTGHLPRGVHPTLDELLTIHDTVLSFIRSNTLTIDAIPEEFQSSASVSEYLEALEIIEEQTMMEESHLETARLAKETLTTPPEKADDTLIHLTDLQRTQVVKLYDMLLSEWNQFLEVLKTTRDDLVQVENTLIDTEEIVAKYREHITEVNRILEDYRLKLEEISPRKDKNTPAEETQETVDTYQNQLDELSEQFDQFENTIWSEFHKTTQGLPKSVMLIVQSQYTETVERRNALTTRLEKERQSCKDFKKGLLIKTKIQAIESELEVIQSMMEDSGEEKETTNDTILTLENKVAEVKTSIYSLKEEYSDLFSRDDRLILLLNDIQTKYKIVNNWVDQVRVWFVEAERIRSWLEEYIETIHQKNADDSSKVDPLSSDVLIEVEEIDVITMIDEHKKLEKIINRFNEDDMARLRTHVKTLTMNGDDDDEDIHNLSPADATTIEITLNTLNTLNRLMSLLQTRSKFVNLLETRLRWEELIGKTTEWCRKKGDEISTFVQKEARWLGPQEDEEEVSALQIKQKNEDIIHTLVSYENAIADFDKGDFSLVLDIYQEMEDIEQGTLPSHLEERQEDLEKQLELTMNKCSLARKVVEQHLVVNDTVSQFKKLKSEGEKIKMLMTHNSSPVSSSRTERDSPENNFDNRIRQFKDTSSYWVTTLLKHIPYPEIVVDVSELKEMIEESNQLIQAKMNDYSMYLAEITEDLEGLLLSHRETLSLQQRASLAYDDLLRITTWLEERLRSLLKFDSSMLEQEDVIVIEDDVLDRIEKEHDGIVPKLKQLEDRDIARTLDIVQRIEIEIEETNSTSIDRVALINGIEHLEEMRDKLKVVLLQRTRELDVLKKRIDWETQCEEATRSMCELAYKLWDFHNKFAQYDIEGVKKRTSSSSVDSMPSRVDSESELEQLQTEVNAIDSKFTIVVDDSLFKELQEAYKQLIICMAEAEEEDRYLVVVPNSITERQSEVNQCYQDLKELSTYVISVMQQNQVISDYVKSCAAAMADGETVQEDLQTFLRESHSSSGDCTPDIDISRTELLERIKNVKDQICSLYEQSQAIQCLQCGDWFLCCETQSVLESNEYNMQIKEFVDKKAQSLQNLQKSIDEILGTYQSVDVIKEKLEEYQETALLLQEWIDKATEELNKRRIDITSVNLAHAATKDALPARKVDNDQALKDLDEFEANKLSEFQKKIEDLLTDASNSPSSVAVQVIDSCRTLTENLTRGVATLHQGIASEVLVLDAADYRLKWEDGLEGGQRLIEDLNTKLQQYISKKNKCVAQQDSLSEDSIQSLYNDLEAIETHCKKIKEEIMESIQNQYEAVKSSFLKLPLVKSIPGHLQERMELFQRTFRKSEEAIVHRQKELEYIKQRGKLEADIQEAMLSLELQRKVISSFIEEHARWSHSDSGSQDSEEFDVEEQWRKEKASFDCYRKATLADIKKFYNELQAASNSSKPGFMSELHAKKIEALNQAESYLAAEICYARDVVAQRKQLTVFLEKVSQLEQVSEVIREEVLLKITLDTPESEPAAHLEEFKVQVAKVSDFAKLNILTPKRSNEDDIPMPIKVKDKTMNSVVQDVISTKLGRLDELVESLYSQLKSQEVFTRLQYVLRTFKKQIAACEKWIEARRKILEKSVHILDDEDLALDINHLRDAVSEADSIQTAMKAYDNNFTLLCKYREKYIATFEEQELLSDEEREERLTEYDEVSERFDNINRMWQDLLLETSEVSNALSNALLPAELNGRIALLMESFEVLSNEIKSVDQSSVTDEQISQWQKRIDHLEAKEYDRLHFEIADYRHTISADMMESLKTKLDTAGDIVLEIRATLTSLYDIINAIRLQNTHAENATLFQKASVRAFDFLDFAQNNFGSVVEKRADTERTQHLKNLIALQKKVKETISECLGFYDDSCSYYTGLRVQDLLTEQSKVLQKEVEDSWQKIQEGSSALSALITRTSKWIEACDGLDKLTRVLSNIRNEVERFIINNVTSHKSSNKIQRFEKQLLQAAVNQDELEQNVKNTEDLLQDEASSVLFFNQSQELRDMSLSIQLMLDQRRLERERIALFDTFNNEIAKVSKVCEDQITYIRQQSSTNPENHLKKSDAIKSVVNAYTAALSHIEDNYHECKSKYDGIISDQATKLIKTYQQPASDVEAAKRNLDKLLKELQALLQTENDYITSLKLLKKLISLDKEITRSVAELKSGASRSFGNNKIAVLKTTLSSNGRSKEIPELRNFMQRYDSTEGSVKIFYKRCDELKKTLNRRASTARINAIIKAVDRRKEDMGKKWNEIKSSADETRTRLSLLHKHQAINSKLADSLRYVEDLKERVEALQLSGKSVSVEEQELEELQEEINGTLKKSVTDIDILLKAIYQSQLRSSVSESPLKAQRDRLVNAIEELRALVKERQEQAHTEGSITEFFGITNQIDAEILRLSKAIEQTSIQHASVNESKFNKSDLQALLKTLVTTYKTSEPTVTELLAQAKSEAQKQFLDDNDRVANAIKKTMKDWANIQASVASREKELQTCIKELDHEFFTKLAMARTSPREKKPRRDSSAAAQSLAVRPAGSFRSSTVSTELKMTVPSNSNSRRAKSPSISAGRRPSTYVADPKSELDVQLGRIINESPYKMKVKRVAGEVGKYWFGDEHPRLVYCRILPSKMVMVRVGGGWVELGKYMKGKQRDL